MIADRDGSGDTPSGAFASSLDADSEGEEGKFYVWTEPEIDGLRGDDAALFKAHYDVRPPGNWEGKSILNRSAATSQGGTPPADAETEDRLAACREMLLAARAGRIRPGGEDKVRSEEHTSELQ